MSPLLPQPQESWKCCFPLTCQGYALGLIHPCDPWARIPPSIPPLLGIPRATLPTGKGGTPRVEWICEVTQALLERLMSHRKIRAPVLPFSFRGLHLTWHQSLKSRAFLLLLCWKMSDVGTPVPLWLPHISDFSNSTYLLSLLLYPVPFLVLF